MKGVNKNCILSGPIMMGPIPSDGIDVLTAALPLTPPGPYAIPLQAGIGFKWTNLCMLNVE